MKVLEILAATFAQAIGMMVSPLSLIAMVVVLMGPKPGSKGAAFTLGWFTATGLLIYGAIRVGAATASERPTLGNGITQVVVGLIFLFFGAKNLRTGWQQRHDPQEPSWIEKMQTWGIPIVFVVSFGLAITNVKNIPIAAQVVTKVSTLGPLSHSQAVVAAVLFVLVTSLPFLLPTIWIVVDPDRARRNLGHARTILGRYEHFIMGVLFLMMGAQSFGSGMQIVIAKNA